MKSYLVSVSGSFFTHNGDLEEFEIKDQHVPFNKDMGLVEASIRKRFAPMWIMLSQQYRRIKTIRLVYIDEIKEGGQHHFGFEGKDIREMNMEELQYLAGAANLREIQLFRKTDLRTMRATAYYLYAERVLGEPVDQPMDLFNIMKAPPLQVKGSQRPGKLPESDAEKMLDKIPEDGTL